MSTITSQPSLISNPSMPLKSVRGSRRGNWRNIRRAGIRSWFFRPAIKLNACTDDTVSRRRRSSKGAEATNAGWRSLCKFIARYRTTAVLKIRSPNLFQQTLSSILQKRSIDRPLPAIPSLVAATTPPHAQHGVHSTIRFATTVSQKLGRCKAQAPSSIAIQATETKCTR